jgi:hypothetical protein
VKTYLIAALVWLLRAVLGPKPKSPRVTVVVKDESVIAEERKHLEELKAEVGRIERELKNSAAQSTTAIMARKRARVKFLDRELKRLRTERRTAIQRRDDFERLTGAGR